MAEDENSVGSAIAATLGINVVLFLISISSVIYGLSKLFPEFYFPVKNRKMHRFFSPVSTLLPRVQNLGAFLKLAFWRTKFDTEAHFGTEAHIYEFFQKSALIYTLLASCYAIFVLAPVNFFAGDQFSTFFERTSSDNIESDGNQNVLWVHVFSVAFFAALFCGQVYYFLREAARSRQRYLAAPRIENFTLMLTEVPPRKSHTEGMGVEINGEESKGTTADSAGRVFELMEMIFPGKVAYVTVPPDMSQLEKVREDMEEAEDMLKYLRVRYGDVKPHRLTKSLLRKQQEYQEVSSEVTDMDSVDLEFGKADNSISSARSGLGDLGEEEGEVSGRATSPQELRNKVNSPGRNKSHAKSSKSKTPKPRPMMRVVAGSPYLTPWKHVVGGEKVDMIDYYDGEREICLDILRAATQNGPRLDASRVAFVTFNERETVAQATSVVLHGHYKERYIPQWAGPPEDINWQNLHIRHKEFKLRKFFVELAMLVVAFYWQLLTGFVSVIANIPVYIDAGFLRWVGGDFTEFYATFASSIALFILMRQLNNILEFVSKNEGRQKKISRVAAFLRRQFILLIWNVLVVQTVFSSVSTILEFLADPNIRVIAVEVASAMSKVSGFFIAYIIQLSFLGVSADFLRLPDLLYFLYYTRANASSRNAEEFVEAPSFKFASGYAQGLLILVLATSFGAISPLIFPAALLYFCTKRILDTYTMFYVSSFKHDTGGELAGIASRLSLTGLYIFTLGMAGYFLLRGQEFKGVVAVILAVAALYISLHIKKEFTPFLDRAIYLNLRRTDVLDRAVRQASASATDSYRQSFEGVMDDVRAAMRLRASDSKSMAESPPQMPRRLSSPEGGFSFLDVSEVASDQTIKTFYYNPSLKKKY